MIFAKNKSVCSQVTYSYWKKKHGWSRNRNSFSFFLSKLTILVSLSFTLSTFEPHKEGQRSKCLDHKWKSRLLLLPVYPRTSLAIVLVRTWGYEQCKKSSSFAKRVIAQKWHNFHLRTHCIWSSPMSEQSTVPPRTRGTESLSKIFASLWFKLPPNKNLPI